ncbi:helix-turn-helix domain-containing protein [Actinoplanes sp. NPDC049265]|uniref:AraC family transcriptional regulator n=1 Tax=Actinoplanes sp. NPDC049265 TaxID=3363902 RepID=UPI003715B497
MFDSDLFDVAPYAGFDPGPVVRRTRCSWTDAGWRSLLVQHFTHAPAADELILPAVADLHLVLVTGGEATMETSMARGWRRRRWTPGHLEAMPPHRATRHRYRGARSLRTVQVHLPGVTLARAAAELEVRPADPEVLPAAAGPLVAEMIRTLGSAPPAGDLYAESAAAFLAAHLVAGNAAERRLPAEDARVRRALVVMRERLAEPLTLAELAGEVHLSVYHFVRVFRDAVGETPHRHLTRMRIEEARRLLDGTGLTVAAVAERCGFAGPEAFSAAFRRHTGVRPSAYRNS